MADRPTGSQPRETIPLIEAAVERCGLDLAGLTVLTEAATGPYAVTPIIAGLSGAVKVFAVAPARGGQEEEDTLALAEAAGVSDRVEIIAEKTEEALTGADIITNSGHVRPIDREAVHRLKPTAVIPLMYEAWEFRAKDLDLPVCRERGIAVAGTNERNPAVDVFSYLGAMAIKLLQGAGWTGIKRLLLLCDNDFAPFIEDGVKNIAPEVDLREKLPGEEDSSAYDAILVALKPGKDPVLGLNEARTIAKRWPEAKVVQFWGDIDRLAFREPRIPVWPIREPAKGHMGILPSDVGADPVVRLQSGGLKVGEILSRARLTGKSVEEALALLEETGYGERVNPIEEESI